ncbi:hypothetical protein E4T66_10150 [Sinimarinibacterium sp. CAU 1509]|uniref:hypothetical protein n=1 Tax=Sinimarinibacterium sp. CAU 1509 TaxID=2562283 RepID=UPI0010ABC18D|nr:hypothetical protein [Sinimarinibacterium sp. CAU 1509]TJY60994.1 hypothetical protein E4T66_10150 [Sinimarinibacterium sp. CAU 1509]
MYYMISTQGPSGFDDAVQMSIVSSPAQYASGVTHLLHADIGSEEQEAGLHFAEYVASDAAVREALISLAESHPDQRTKALIRQTLGSPGKAEPGIQPDGPASGGSAG